MWLQKAHPFAFSSIIATRDGGTRRGILLVVLGVVERFLPRGIEVAVVRIVIRVPSQRTGPNQLAGRWRLLNRRFGTMTVEGAGLEDTGDGNLRKNAEPYRAVAES